MEHSEMEKDSGSGGQHLTRQPSSWGEFLGSWPLDWVRDGKQFSVWTRLGFLIPAAPWPVLIWFVLQGPQNVGPHGSAPLRIVAAEAEIAIIACTLAGVLCHAVAAKSVRAFLAALLLLTIHFALMYDFFETQQVIYL